MIFLAENRFFDKVDGKTRFFDEIDRFLIKKHHFLVRTIKSTQIQGGTLGFA